MHEHADDHVHHRIMEDNDQLACENFKQWNERKTLVINFMSAPGAGKTTLICQIGSRIKAKHSICVIEGDMVGDLDARKIQDAGIPSFQITTGRSCHLDAAMIARLITANTLPQSDFVIIENVGNLVCPAEFPLGEHLRIVLLSVTEGDDKPLKYPVIFHGCDAVVLTKTDLLEHVDFDSSRVTKAISGINPRAKVFEVSSKTGVGIDKLVEFIEHSANGDRVMSGSVENTQPVGI
jgi:hydrogenase accessory protein HypB